MQGGSLIDSNFPSMVMPLMWPEVQVNGNRQNYQQQWQFDTVNQPVWGREEDGYNFITPENSLLSYDSSANSGRLQLADFWHDTSRNKFFHWLLGNIVHIIMLFKSYEWKSNVNFG